MKYIILIIVIVLFVFILIYYNKTKKQPLLLTNVDTKQQIINDLKENNLMYLNIKINGELEKIVIKLNDTESAIHFKMLCYFNELTNTIINKSTKKYIEFPIKFDDIKDIQPMSDNVQKIDRGTVLYSTQTHNIMIVTQKTVLDPVFIILGNIKIGFEYIKKIKLHGGTIINSGLSK